MALIHTEDPMDSIFYDSHGNAWATCAPDAPGAEAFGPTGAARPAPWAPTWKDAESGGILHRATACHEWDTIDLDLSLYGDEFHDRLCPAAPRRPYPAAVTWCKSGFVRATLVTAHATVPLWDYDHVSDVIDAAGKYARIFARVGEGASVLDQSDALSVMDAEITRFLRLLDRCGGLAAELRREGDLAVGGLPPRRWGVVSPIDWMIAATQGVAVEYDPEPGVSWCWCTPQRAREIATRPLDPTEYLYALQVVRSLLAI